MSLIINITIKLDPLFLSFAELSNPRQRTHINALNWSRMGRHQRASSIMYQFAVLLFIAAFPIICSSAATDTSSGGGTGATNDDINNHHHHHRRRHHQQQQSRMNIPLGAATDHQENNNGGGKQSIFNLLHSPFYFLSLSALDNLNITWSMCDPRQVLGRVTNWS